MYMSELALGYEAIDCAEISCCALYTDALEHLVRERRQGNARLLSQVTNIIIHLLLLINLLRQYQH